MAHTGQTVGRKKLGTRKEIFLVSGDGVGVKEYGFTFQGLNKFPSNEIKQQQEQNRFWSDFVGTRNLPLD